MSTKRLAYWAILVSVPALVGFLWLASGRERLTKHFRTVSVAETNDLFGDTAIVQKFIPGPILGYYVGLDLVVIVVLVSLAIASTVSLVKLLARRRAAREEPA